MDYVLGFLCLFFGCGIILFIGWTASATSRLKKKIAEKYGAKFYSTLKHIEGLPIVGGVMVDVYYTPNKIIFIKDQQEIMVNTEKVKSVDVATGKDIKSQQATGAIAGNLILGGLTGALVGSLIATSTYLIITYESNDEVKSIILDTAASGTFALNVQKDFKKNLPQKKRKNNLIKVNS